MSINLIQQSKKLLILAANPVETARLRLDIETRDIKEGLKQARERKRFIVESEWAVRPRDIRRAILDFEPHLVHFAGHGSQDGLIFEDDLGQKKLISTEAIAGLFGLFSEQIECILLNSCYSEVQADAIVEHIDYVIGMPQEIGDKAATEFAVAFYDALGAGRCIDDAYKFGCNAIQLMGLSEKLKPALKKSKALLIIKPNPSETNGDSNSTLKKSEESEESEEFLQTEEISKVRYEFVISGTLEEYKKTRVEALVNHLREITGDASITLLRIESGSIKLILEGSEEGLRKLEALLRAGQIEEVLNISVQNLRVLSYSKVTDKEILQDSRLELNQAQDKKILEARGRAEQYLNYYGRQISHEEQLLYDHFLECVRFESALQVISRFKSLFFNESEYPNPQIKQALDTILSIDNIEENFKYILNRCCYILINSWLMEVTKRQAISDLISTFDKYSFNFPESPKEQQLQNLIKHFTQTEQYVSLQFLDQVINPASTNISGARPVRTLIHRYPFLYESFFRMEGNSGEYIRRIKLAKEEAQRQFEIDLFTYIESRQQQLRSSQYRNNFSQDMPNPTLLSNEQLDIALHSFAGKIENNNTCRELAEKFLTENVKGHSYASFKRNLYEYLTSSVDSSYAEHNFNHWLFSELQQMMPENNDMGVNDLLFIGTCRKILNLLMLQSPWKREHTIFIDLLANIDIIPTINVLLKIVLICRKLTTFLEKKFAILFKQYESYEQSQVSWLIQSLEALQVAFTTNFGRTNFSKLDLSF